MQREIGWSRFMEFGSLSEMPAVDLCDVPAVENDRFVLGNVFVGEVDHDVLAPKAFKNEGRWQSDRV